ncbi:hypothetical protein GGF42_005674 [Coemansia sp. RSA 2424]|nr:hypothetical protein GGF42_005674 [Coemansia sp. RSA 2424]
MEVIVFAQPLAPFHMLDGDNYLLWRVLVLDVLDRLNLKNAVKGPYLVTTAEWRELTDQRKSQTVAILLKCIKPDIAIEYCDITCPYELWTELKKKYDPSEG